jgi:hypothetical protein
MFLMLLAPFKEDGGRGERMKGRRKEKDEEGEEKKMRRTRGIKSVG